MACSGTRAGLWRRWGRLLMGNRGEGGYKGRHLQNGVLFQNLQRHLPPTRGGNTVCHPINLARVFDRCNCHLDGR